MMKSARITILVLTTCLISPPRQALSQGPPIHTDTPILLGLEGKAATTRAVVVRKSKLYRDATVIGDPLQREVTAWTFPVAVPYNITSDLLVGTMVPFVRVEAKSIAGTNDSFGLSDISLFAKYLVVQVDALQETFRVIVKGNIKLPTGSKNRTPALGTGTVDYSLGTVGAWIGKRFGIYGDASYAFNGTSEGHKFGNAIIYNLALGFRAFPAVYETYPASQWNLYLELNGKFAARDKSNSEVRKDTGGNAVLLSPGLQYIPTRQILLEAAIQLPLIQNLSGTQLGTDYSVLVGLRALLF